MYEDITREGAMIKKLTGHQLVSVLPLKSFLYPCPLSSSKLLYKDDLQLKKNKRNHQPPISISQVFEQDSLCGDGINFTTMIMVTSAIFEQDSLSNSNCDCNLNLIYSTIHTDNIT